MLRKLLMSTLLASPLILAGCSALPFSDFFADSDDKSRKEEKKLAAIAARPEIPPNVLLNSGIRNVNQGNSKNAQKAFSELNKQHPFSTEAQRSLILSAYTHFTDKEYDETIGKARQFLTLYPGSKDAAYMQYLIGESYHVRIGSVVLDQGDTAKGLQAYSDLVRLYPQSKYAPDSKQKMLFLADQLAGKEMQIGRYYQERRQHLAAVNRFRTVVDTHQTTRHIEEALFRLTESYLALGLVNDARSATSLLGHNYPDSEWYADAYGLITGEKVKSRKGAGSKVAGLVPFVGNKNKKAEEGETSNVANPTGIANPADDIVSTLPVLDEVKQEPVFAAPSVPSTEPVEAVAATRVVNVPAAPAVPSSSLALPATPAVAAVPTSVNTPAAVKPAKPDPVELSEQIIIEQEKTAKKKRSGLSRFVPFVGGKKKEDKDS